MTLKRRPSKGNTRGRRVRVLRMEISPTQQDAIAMAARELCDVRLASSSKFLAATTLPFPSYIPMQSKFNEGEFYVRVCYAQYYEYIKTTLSGRIDGMTVTGTTGIGKSMFMAYYFLCYRLEHPARTVLLAAYDCDSNLKRVVVWKNQTVHKLVAGDGTAMQRVLSKFMASDTLVLLDGPPAVVPEFGKFVCFTSPNEKWYTKTQKDQYISRAVLPVWEMEELRAAAQSLQYLSDLLKPMDPEKARALGLDASAYDGLDEADGIKVRAYVFGRVARACLETDPKRVVFRFEKLQTAMNGAEDRTLTSEERRQLCHFYLCDPGVIDMNYYVDVGSPYIKQQLRERMVQMDESTRRAMERWLVFDSMAASEAGFVVERRVHQLLIGGTTFDARLLGVDQQQQLMRRFTVNKSVSPDAVESTSTRVQLTESPNFIPISTTMVSMDLFYYCHHQTEDVARNSSATEQPRVILFQVAAAMNYPLKSDAIVDVLTRLGLWKHIGESVLAEYVALVFVVPATNAVAFTKQRYLVSSVAAGAVVRESEEAVVPILETIPQFVWGV